MNLKQLFIGSEGTLGLLTNVTLLCAPLPTSRTVIILELESFQHLTKVLRMSKSLLGGHLSAFEMADKPALRILQDQTEIEVPLPMRNNFFALIEITGSGLCVVSVIVSYDLLQILFFTGDEQLAVDTFMSNVVNSKLCVDGVVSQDEKQADEIWAIRENISEAVRREGANELFVYQI